MSKVIEVTFGHGWDSPETLRDSIEVALYGENLNIQDPHLALKASRTYGGVGKGN